MKIDMTEEVAKRDSFISWAICSLISGKKEMDGAFPNREAMVNAEVKLTVNGQELDFVKVLNRLGDDLDRQVKEKAVELLNEKFNNSFNQLTDDLEAVRRHLREKFELPERDY